MPTIMICFFDCVQLSLEDNECVINHIVIMIIVIMSRKMNKQIYEIFDEVPRLLKMCAFNSLLFFGYSLQGRLFNCLVNITGVLAENAYAT